MQEVFWLIPDQLGGRTGPDRRPWDLPAMRAAGVGAILSVNDGLLCHPEDFAAADIRYACIPLSANAPPQRGDDDLCVRALPEAHAFVSEQLAQGRRTVVHCSSGKDRTGLYLAYHWMKHAGVGPEVAIRAVMRVRPIALSAMGWDEHALDVLRRC